MENNMEDSKENHRALAISKICNTMALFIYLDIKKKCLTVLQ